MPLFEKLKMIHPDRALRGRPDPIMIPGRHAVLGTPLDPPDTYERMIVGMGCFWGAERIFWKEPGVYTTAVGYAGGYTPNPTYEEVCSGSTGHTEVVMVAFDPSAVSYERLLQLFWEQHNPTQGMRQGNDTGTQYRSMIMATNEQLPVAQQSRDVYQQQLSARKYGTITTEIIGSGPFYYAEEYHQQYLHKVPNGYCGLYGTGVSCPVGLQTSVG